MHLLLQSLLYTYIEIVSTQFGCVFQLVCVAMISCEILTELLVI